MPGICAKRRLACWGRCVVWGHGGAGVWGGWVAGGSGWGLGSTMEWGVDTGERNAAAPWGVGSGSGFRFR
jgi:hypothetical protein